MEFKYTATGNRNHAGHLNSKKQHCAEDLDRLAHDLDATSRSLLRDGVLGGVLTGNEAEIRQDAIQLVLQWILRDDNETKGDGEKSVNGTGHLQRTVALALRITKLRLARSLTRDAKACQRYSDDYVDVSLHQSDLPPWAWPDPVRRAMALSGLKLAARTGKISHANACVATLIIDGQMSVAQVAKRRNVTRGAIYQQLYRVMKVLPAVIESMEFQRL